MKLGNDFYSFLGLAVKAGKCVFGAEASSKGVKTGKVLLLIADSGLSDRSRKDAVSMCEFYETELIIAEPPGRCGRACGKPDNKLIGVTDHNFAERLIELSKHAEV